MTLPQGYRMAQAATHRQPCLDYPYTNTLVKDNENKINKLS